MTLNSFAAVAVYVCMRCSREQNGITPHVYGTTDVAQRESERRRQRLADRKELLKLGWREHGNRLWECPQCIQDHANHIEAANQWMAYQKGWVAGAACTAIDASFAAGHENQKLRAAYDLGYRDGRSARRSAMEAASVQYGYHPSVLRLQSEGPA